MLTFLIYCLLQYDIKALISLFQITFFLQYSHKNQYYNSEIIFFLGNCSCLDRIHFHKLPLHTIICRSWSGLILSALSAQQILYPFWQLVSNAQNRLTRRISLTAELFVVQLDCNYLIFIFLYFILGVSLKTQLRCRSAKGSSCGCGFWFCRQ